jgi:hypothetical protein
MALWLERISGTMRWIAPLFVSSLVLSSASASLDRREPTALTGRIPHRAILSSSGPVEKNDEYRITQDTEVLLDGRPCRFEQVPKDATIVLLETITNESKEISRIHFRSARRTKAPVSK